MASVVRRIRPVASCSACTRDGILKSGLLAAAVISRSASTSTYGDRSLLRPFEELDPNTVTTPRDERRLLRAGITPIGSRRRRAALQTSQGLPFEQMPYQCFQEALKVLKVDRDEKIRQIEVERARIARLRASDPPADGGEALKQRRLISMEQYLEKLKILADINDPTVKKRFEDKLGDMNRPIYRHLLNKKWRQYRRPLVMQRITQMNVIPDLLMKIDPTYDVTFAFGRKTVPPGQILPSNVTEFAPMLNVQVFDKGERLVTVVVIDPDVPDVEKDGFSHRCHYIATNIPISPTSTSISLQSLAGGEEEVLPWLPPHSQKGSPYHRLAIFVLEQGKGHTLDPETLKKTTKRLGFNFRSFLDKYAPLKPTGVTMFRTVWDEGMDDVMTRAGIEATDVEFKRTKIEALPYRTKASVRYR